MAAAPIAVYDELTKQFASFVVDTPQCGTLGALAAPSIHSYATPTPADSDVCQCGKFFYAGARGDQERGAA